jgi:hypothetical protein
MAYVLKMYLTLNYRNSKNVNTHTVWSSKSWPPSTLKIFLTFFVDLQWTDWTGLYKKCFITTVWCQEHDRMDSSYLGTSSSFWIFTLNRKPIVRIKLMKPLLTKYFQIYVWYHFNSNFNPRLQTPCPIYAGKASFSKQIENFIVLKRHLFNLFLHTIMGMFETLQYVYITVTTQTSNLNLFSKAGGPPWHRWHFSGTQIIGMRRLQIHFITHPLVTFI